MNEFYKIGAFAKLCGVSVRTLRHYESLGLLVPAQIDKWTGYRNYHADQLKRMEKIKKLKAAGLSLEEIGVLMKSESQTPDQELLKSKISQTESQIKELEERKCRLNKMLGARNKYRPLNRLKIFCCPACGNVSFVFGKASMECCDTKLEPLEIVEAAEEDRYTSTEMDGEYLLQYGCPMTKSHYIAAVIVERYDNIALFRMFPEQSAAIRIPFLPGSKIYTIYRKDGLVWATMQK